MVYSFALEAILPSQLGFLAYLTSSHQARGAAWDFRQA
jgi:hypothetical protein